MDKLLRETIKVQQLLAMDAAGVIVERVWIMIARTTVQDTVSAVAAEGINRLFESTIMCVIHSSCERDEADLFVPLCHIC